MDQDAADDRSGARDRPGAHDAGAVSYTHLRAHETVLDLVCRLLLEKQQSYEQTALNSGI